MRAAAATAVNDPTTQTLTTRELPARRRVTHFLRNRPRDLRRQHAHMVGQSREMFSLFCIGFEHTHHRECCRVRAQLVEALLHTHGPFLTERTTPIGCYRRTNKLEVMLQKLEPNARNRAALACVQMEPNAASGSLEKNPKNDGSHPHRH